MTTSISPTVVAEKFRSAFAAADQLDDPRALEVIAAAVSEHLRQLQTRIDVRGTLGESREGGGL